MSGDYLSIARRAVERAALTDPDHFDRVVADGLSGCQNVIDESINEETVEVEDGEDEDTVIVVMPNGDKTAVSLSDIEKMLSVQQPYEAWAAIIALMPRKLVGEGW